MSDFLLHALLGFVAFEAGFALCWWRLRRRYKSEIRVVVPPEALMRAINEGKLEIRVIPNVMVDWSVLNGIIAAHGYMLVARAEASPPRTH